MSRLSVAARDVMPEDSFDEPDDDTVVVSGERFGHWTSAHVANVAKPHCEQQGVLSRYSGRGRRLPPEGQEAWGSAPCPTIATNSAYGRSSAPRLSHSEFGISQTNNFSAVSLGCLGCLGYQKGHHTEQTRRRIPIRRSTAYTNGGRRSARPTRGAGSKKRVLGTRRHNAMFMSGRICVTICRQGWRPTTVISNVSCLSI